jgi:RNA polymerase sigma-70 factor, ECF subfamily
VNETCARSSAELAARASYGRLLALIASRSGDIASAEDALADAFVAALRTWPEQGVPRSPDAWLLTAARNALANSRRHDQVRSHKKPELEQHLSELLEVAPQSFPDARLRLLFVCAHPAIDTNVRTPLMLQTVLGLDAARIASAFLVAPATMSQRLVRAKSKIRDAGMRFEEPDPATLGDRLPDVLNAIYAAFGAGWDDLQDPDVQGLAGEAIFLGQLVAELLPDQPEALGLLALMLFCDARKEARRDAEGRFVPLARQDTRLWSGEAIVKAESLLTAAARHRRFGRFQCEAAIQSVHVQRPITGRINHDALLKLYDMLANHAPSMGVLVGQAAVLLDAGRASDSLAALDALPAELVATYQPYWVTRARVLAELGSLDDATCLERAIGLTRDPNVRAFLSISAKG